MTSLKDRLRQLQVPAQQAEAPLPEMTLEELGSMEVKFGSTHRGKTFDHLWQHNQDWIKFMVDHYSKSTKEDHRFLLMYIEKKVTHAEKNQEKIPLTRGHTAPTMGITSGTKGYAKSFAKPKRVPKNMSNPNPVVVNSPSDIEDYEEEDWSELEMVEPQMDAETKADVQALQARMLNLENMLEKVVAHLSQGSTQQEPI